MIQNSRSKRGKRKFHVLNTARKNVFTKSSKKEINEKKITQVQWAVQT